MYAGVAQWVPPMVVYKIRGEKRMDCVDTVCDITLRDGGTTIKMSDKTSKIVEDKLIELECAGDFVGTGKWTFELADGKTKVQKRVNYEVKRMSFVLLSPFVNMRKANSDLMQKGFKGLNDYLIMK